MVVGSKMVLPTLFLLQREGMQEIFIIDLFLWEAPNFVFLDGFFPECYLPLTSIYVRKGLQISTVSSSLGLHRP